MNILFAALGLLLLYGLQRLIYRKHWNRGLSASISYSKQTAVEGEEAALIEVITSDKVLPLPNLSVKFQTSRNLKFLNSENSAVTDLYYRSDIFSFHGREKITRTLPFICSRRGYYTITETALSSTDLFFSEKYSQLNKNFTQLFVYPRYVDIRKLLIPFNQLYGSILAQRHFYEDPFEFRSIREYQPFDPMKAVNWKAFARTDELMVNTFEDTSSQEVCIYLNLENHGYVNHYDIMEENIRLAATLSDMFVSKGIPVSLKTNGCDCTSKLPVYVDAGTGANHQTRMLQSLARIDLDLPLTHLSQQMLADRNSGHMASYNIVISNYCQPDFCDEINHLAANKSDFLLLYTYHKEMYQNLQVSSALSKHVMYWEVEHLD